MKRHMAGALLLVGIGLIITAISATLMGKTLAPLWAGGRVLLFSGGLLVVALGAWVPSRPGSAGVAAPQDISDVRGQAEDRIREWFRSNWLGIAAGTIVALAFVLYAFFGSTGTWTVWPETSRYYDDLGAALRAGHLDLHIQPPSTLLAVPDPYDPSARNGIPGLKALVAKVWDLTFYKGKFYVYWGPVPGLLLAAVKIFYGGPIADQHLTFAFLCGLLIFVVLLLWRVRAAFYQDVPGGLVLLGIAVAALAYPIPWMLSHAAIYEASTSAAQFFLIGGLYFAYRGLEKAAPSTSYLLLASVFWTLALGSRLLIAFPAAFLECTTFAWAIRKSRADGAARDVIGYAAALGSPLLVGGLALFGYNWLRFGSILETGIRYTLTSENLSRYFSETFRTLYAAPNLWLYLLSPVKLQAGFPFIMPTRVLAAVTPAALSIHHVEQTTGLLYAIPFILFSVVPGVELARWASGKLSKTREPADAGDGSALAWLFTSLLGAALVAFVALLLYFYVAIRFLADFVPSLVLLSVLGMWHGYHYFHDRPAGRTLYGLAAFVLAIASFVVSLLLTMAESLQQFQAHNPHLMRQILLFFRH